AAERGGGRRGLLRPVPPHPALHAGPRGGSGPVRADRPAGQRTAARASSRVKFRAYRALPTIEPSRPSGASSDSFTRSSTLDTPPEAITGASVRAQTSRSSSVFGPCRVPSLLTSVTT